MVGYDKQEAAAYILSKLNPNDYSALPVALSILVEQAIDGDLKYMVSCGVIDDEGFGGEIPYDEDDAFEYILEYLMEENALDGDMAMIAASFLNDFVELQYKYMEKKGLVIVD